ncbi:6,7-dimethyl-8-ribityllumazine synthase [Candidatus Woesearchaeota archaeon]|jgi:6,7-dimethyl-8-ribityllumazine synthase|nr:6,7-dimethyl-8-ribityllumazine synthase [Candidatus Woesearchaeota archaeon]MAH33596.1 6,7-dimethyl-8-ribityllumazine synthase [archaeon]MDP6548436.1 6,7-dimethyl-8-ribityllumazine synthase [Candidatus Woesearchaeota archaeon]|tara:strand:- start:832 stop:1248 length:417 start_codon:yes stop_codon:yes gene_type:complete
MRIKIGLVVSDFNDEITSKMEKYAEKYADSLNAEIVKKVNVPGVFEIPFAAKNLLKEKKINSLVALGAVIQGDTDHDIIVANNAVQKLMELSLHYNKPVGMGIIGPRATWQQAEERAEEYAKRAVKVAVEMVKASRTL